MLDPRTALQELQRLSDAPCAEWQAASGRRDVGCPELAAAQGSLRAALAAGGTHHDVLGRLGRTAAEPGLPGPVRAATLAVMASGRAASLRPVEMALRQMGAASA